jgi:uncharacterized protein (DUF362 family)
MNRRTALSGITLAGAAGLTAPTLWRHNLPRRAPQRSSVAILRCTQYETCARVVDDGLGLLGVNVRGKRVVVKPNLVEYSPSVPINTNPILVAAVVDSLYRSGASSVIVAEGPGHVRDTEMLISESGLHDQLHAVGRSEFVDLNYDAAHRIVPKSGLTGFDELWLPQTILNADILISMPKIKTHHWAGVTLSLKNLFGIVPGSVYGWPKNILHWQGIDNSIVELAATVPIHYVIADGIEAMEGNGPLHGTLRRLGCVVFADDPLAADATCCRLMGIEPTFVHHLVMAAPLGNLSVASIDQRGERVENVHQQFKLLPSFAHLRGSL